MTFSFTSFDTVIFSFYRNRMQQCVAILYFRTISITDTVFMISAFEMSYTLPLSSRIKLCWDVHDSRRLYKKYILAKNKIVTRCFFKVPWKRCSFYFPFTPWRRYHRFIKFVEIIHPRSLLISFEKLLSASTSFQSESSLVTWPEYSALIR